MKDKAELLDYTDSFVQRIPRYAIKGLGEDRWHTRDTALSDEVILDHLNGVKAVASLGKWYPSHALLDIDSRDMGYVTELRDSLGMDEDNSMLCTSESEDSYHLLFRPTYNLKPPTIRLLTSILEPFAVRNGVEAYPRANKPARLPFGKVQAILDEGKEHLTAWEERLFWFNKLDEYDLGEVPFSQSLLALEYPDSRGGLPKYDEGREYFMHGLNVPGERNYATFAVLYFLWRKNTTIESAKEIAWTWLKTKHNGKSKTWNARHYNICKKDIESASRTIWSYTDFPDECHNRYAGWIAKKDIERIFRTVNGSVVKAKFLFHLVKHLSPRQHRGLTPIHTGLLIKWSSARYYLDRIKDFSEMGILKRGGSYIVGYQAKELALKWPYSPPHDAVLVDDRAPDHLESTVKACFDAEEYRALLKAASVNRPSQISLTKQAFEGYST